MFVIFPLLSKVVTIQAPSLLPKIILADYHFYILKETLFVLKKKIVEVKTNCVVENVENPFMWRVEEGNYRKNMNVLRT